MVASCDTDDEEPYGYKLHYTVSPQYYQNLRDYKATDHSIWLGVVLRLHDKFLYGYSFSGLPDSLDICSLWGGIPTNDSTLADAHCLPEVNKEMKFVQETKERRWLFLRLSVFVISLNSMILFGLPRIIPFSHAIVCQSFIGTDFL